MARTVQQCNDYIVAELVTQFASIGITITPTTWSSRNLLRLVCYTFAIALSLAEQLQDVALSKMQLVQDLSAAASPLWLQDKILKFQYSSTNPQYLTIVNGVPTYPVINENLRIINACAISSTIANTVNIKLAKGSPLGALSAPELTAAGNYIILIGTAGITYNAISTAADKLYLEGSIYYQGLYSAVIQANVISKLTDYLTNLSLSRFGGDILLSEIIQTIKSVEGVNDVVFNRVSLRYDSQSMFGGIDLVLASLEVNRKYTFGAGYAVQENTATYTWTDKLTFIAE